MYLVREKEVDFNIKGQGAVNNVLIIKRARQINHSWLFYLNIFKPHSQPATYLECRSEWERRDPSRDTQALLQPPPLPSARGAASAGTPRWGPRLQELRLAVGRAGQSTWFKPIVFFLLIIHRRECENIYISYQLGARSNRGPVKLGDQPGDKLRIELGRGFLALLDLHAYIFV